MDDAQLQTIWQQRQPRPAATPLSHSLAVFMKYKLSKRVKAVGKLVGIWQEVIPQALLEHTSLEGFNRGVLTVAVDSASHRFQLDSLLRGGLQREIQRRFSGTLRKVRLVPGQF